MKLCSNLSLGKVFRHLGGPSFFVGLQSVLLDGLGGLQRRLLESPLFSPRLSSSNNLLGVRVGEQGLGDLLDGETSGKVEDHRDGQLGSEL